jgi:hypothetical protein
MTIYRLDVAWVSYPSETLSSIKIQLSMTMIAGTRYIYLFGPEGYDP